MSCVCLYVCLYVLPQIHSPAICVIGEFKLEPRISIVKYISQLWSCVDGYNFKLNEDGDYSSNDNGYCMTTKNARNCSEDGESYFSLSTNDSTIVNGYNFKLNDGESAFSLSTHDFSNGE